MVYTNVHIDKLGKAPSFYVIVYNSLPAKNVYLDRQLFCM